ncbi:hypothetical protein [Flavonifractor sp. An91]|uniref:hypothetical protein n=1 Tax=Flavonifractor sp. An91 TaxID=1965665 RepID=UPI0013A68773|nr:hypothetical protein [Flavonifractor sp. An91]
MKEIMTKLYEKGKRPLSLLLVIIMVLSMVNLTEIFAVSIGDVISFTIKRSPSDLASTYQTTYGTTFEDYFLSGPTEYYSFENHVFRREDNSVLYKIGIGNTPVKPTDKIVSNGRYVWDVAPDITIYINYSMVSARLGETWGDFVERYMQEGGSDTTTSKHDQYYISGDNIRDGYGDLIRQGNIPVVVSDYVQEGEYTKAPLIEFTVQGDTFYCVQGTQWFNSSGMNPFVGGADGLYGNPSNLDSLFTTQKGYTDESTYVYYNGQIVYQNGRPVAWWDTILPDKELEYIEFQIDETVYAANRESTWTTWVENETLNKASFSAVDNNIKSASNALVYYGDNIVESSNEIIESAMYRTLLNQVAINFTVDDKPYSALEGETWSDLLEILHTGEFIVDQGFVKSTLTNSIIKYNENPVTPSDLLINGATYISKEEVRYYMYIDDTKYEFGQDEYGNNMTWSQWVESSYNTDGIKINPSNSEVELLDGTPVCMNGNPVHSYETIYEQKYTAKNITFSVNYESLISSDNSTWQNWLGTSNNINNYTTDNTNVYDNYGDKILQPVTHIPVTVGDNIIKNTRYVTQISFYIDEQEYEGYSDYTWLDWVSSDFNTDNKFSINKDGLLVDNLGNKVGQIQWDNSVIYENSYSQLQRDIHYSILYNQETTVEFMIDSVTYEKYDYMTWSEWLESDFNTDGFTIGNYDAYSQGVLSSVGNVVCHYDFTYDGSWLWTVGLQENIVTDKNYQTFAPIAPQFHIGSNTYFMNEGQMWRDWLMSPANTDNYLYGYSDEKGMGIYVTLDGTNYIVTDMGTTVQRENQITKDYTYNLEVIDGEISELIEFWVEGNQLYAKKDMPWGEWISSSFNTVGYTLDGENIKDGDRVLYYRDWSSSTSGTPESILVGKTDVIDNHFEYLFEDKPNVDIEKIQFNIETTSYEAETDMSWSSWVSSTYGKGFSIVESDAYGQVVVDTAGHVVLENDNSTPVTVMGIIASGGQYYLSDYVVDNGNTDDPGSDVTNPPKDESTYIIVDAEPTMFKVQVPIKIDVSMDTEGTVTTGSGYTVDNLCAMGPVVIENIKVTTATNWKLSDFNADYANMKVSSRVIGLQINGVNVETDGSVIMNDSLSSVIRHAESKELTFAAKLPAQKTGIQENAAAVIFTVDFDKA